MIRIIVREQDVQAAVHVGGRPEYSYRTFDVHLPDLEKYLKERRGVSLIVREVIGAELVSNTDDAGQVTTFEEIYGKGYGS